MTQGAPTQKGDAANETTGNTNVTTEFALPVRIVTDPADEIAAKDREGRAEKREASDLNAQWQAANAAVSAADVAEWGKYPTLIQIGIGVIGLALLGWTLRETRETARAAREGVHEARRTADVAAATLVHAKQSDRPFFIPRSARIARSTINIPGHFIHFDLVNYGTAIGIIRSTYLIVKIGDAVIYETNPGNGEFTPVKPAEIRHENGHFFKIDLDGPCYAGLLDRSSKLSVVMIVKYSRITKRRGWSPEFRFHFVPNKDGSGGPLHWHSADWSDQDEDDNDPDDPPIDHLTPPARKPVAFAP